MDYGLVVAAGRGERFGRPKQYEPLGGRPLLLYSLWAFERSRVEGVALVVPGERLEETRLILKDQGLSKVRWVVAGGVTRADSVWAGLGCLPEEGRVAIHDGVRPCITPQLIDGGFSELDRHWAVVYARKVEETIKEVDGSRVVRTLSRQGVWSVQTPQFFHLWLIRQAYEVARASGFVGPDDAVLVERLGHEVWVIPGPRTNLKITTPEDIEMAELLMRGRS